MTDEERDAVLAEVVNMLRWQRSHAPLGSERFAALYDAQAWIRELMMSPSSRDLPNSHWGIDAPTMADLLTRKATR